jgi:hypothetical protein
MEPFDDIKGGEFLERLNYLQFLSRSLLLDGINYWTTVVS